MQRGTGSLFIDIFILNPIVQQVQENVQAEEGVKAITKLKHKGTRAPTPSDRSLRSKTKLSSNSYAILSDD